jgi:hypothetical protein
VSQKVTFYETGGGLLMALGEWYDPCAAVGGDFEKAWLSVPADVRIPVMALPRTWPLLPGQHAVFDLELFPALREPLERAMEESRTKGNESCMKRIKNLLTDEGGQDMVEYTLLLAFVARGFRQ